MKPQIQPLDASGLQQLSYDLPHRIHAAKAYPLDPSSGLNVIVYGHENGIRIVWRGIDQFPAVQNEVAPFPSLLHTYDILLGGTQAFHIAFPQLPTDVHHDSRSVPKLLAEKLVIAVACSDCNIRVIVLPLSLSEDVAVEQILTLAGNPNHQNLTNSVSVSFTPRPSTKKTDTEIDEGSADMNDTNWQLTSRPSSRTSRRSSSSAEVNWDLLVASHSLDLFGRLIIHRIPCNKTSLDESAEFNIPWRTYCLQSAAISIQFCSALYPSLHHSRLLVAEEHGLVKILDCGPRGANGAWLASYETDFEDSKYSALPKRKHIIDSRWLLGGNAIIVLLANGEWGVWDLGGRSARVVQAASQVLKPVISSQFAVKGRVRTNPGDSNPVLENLSTTTSKLAPMTPSTRKSRQDILFAPEMRQQQTPSRGGICIIPASKAAASRADDDTVLVWHGGNIVIFPSFFAHWQNKISGSRSLLGAKDETKTISNIQYQREACNEVSLNLGSTWLEIVVATEHRLSFIAPAHPQKRSSSAKYLAKPVSALTDDQLLAAGDLDIHGMDRVLNEMLADHDTRNATSVHKSK